MFKVCTHLKTVFRLTYIPPTIFPFQMFVAQRKNRSSHRTKQKIRKFFSYFVSCDWRMQTNFERTKINSNFFARRVFGALNWKVPRKKNTSVKLSINSWKLQQKEKKGNKSGITITICLISVHNEHSKFKKEKKKTEW